MRRIKIANRWVDEKGPSFVIAEAGVNHNGQLRLAKSLVKIAAEAGADAIKFQTYKTENLVTKYAKTARYQKLNSKVDIFQYKELKKLELSKKDHIILKKYCRKLGIIFLSTPYDFDSVDLLNKLDVPAFKISSSDITNLPLLSYVAKKRKPIMLSTGMSDIKEIKEAIKTIRNGGNDDIVLLHCTTDYPLNLKDVNLKAIVTLRKIFKVPIGFSDHTLSTIIPPAAVALGAVIIEKHFTLDRDLPGWDHKASLEPNELKEMVNNIRNVEQSLGTGIKHILPVEKKIKKVAQKSIVANRFIRKGETIKTDMLAIKRPGTGLLPKYFNNLIGKKAKVNLSKDEQISWNKVR